MHALCLGPGNVATQYAEWCRCVNIGSCTTRVFVTTCGFTFAISAWMWNWSREQTSNSAWNSATLGQKLLKWYNVCMEMWQWVMRGVSRGTHVSREAEHHSKMMRVQGELPRAQHLKMWKQFGGLCTRTVREPLRTLLQSLICHTEQSRQFSHVIWTCTTLQQSSCPNFWPPNRKSTMLQFVKSFVSVPWMTHPSCRGSSWGTRVGSTGMIPRLNNSLHNGRAQDPQDRRRLESRSATKSMLIVFFDIRGIVHHEFAPEGQTVNTGFYRNVLRRLREDIRQKRPNCGTQATGCSMMTMYPLTELSNNSIITLLHPPYLPDLAPCDFFLFPKMKLQLKGCRFHRVEEIQQESRNVLGKFREQDFRAHVPAVATALGLMCRCRRALFWRGCCPDLNQVNTF